MGNSGQGRVKRAKAAKPRVIVLRAAGTNCDGETKYAFELAGARADLVHVNRLREGTARLRDYQILAIPGGFTYGDDLAAGRVLAGELKSALTDQVEAFVGAGKLVIGICNGFQVLVKTGLLPAGHVAGEIHEATLVNNDSGKFEDRWVHLRTERRSPCVWTKGIPDIYLPVAHGEGKFLTRTGGVLAALERNRQVVFRYVDERGRRRPGYPANPNGSANDIAGVCDPTGRILGLMPHPERHVLGRQHPRWTRVAPAKRKPAAGDGLALFANAVAYARKRL